MKAPAGADGLTLTALGDAGWALYAAEAYLARRPVDRDELAGPDVTVHARRARIAGTRARGAR